MLSAFSRTSLALVLTMLGPISIQAHPVKGVTEQDASLHADVSTDFDDNKNNAHNVTVIVSPEHSQNHESDTKRAEENIHTQRKIARFTWALVVGDIQTVILATAPSGKRGIVCKAE
jgi:hypothetical protein